jgi:YVTN family beta-propeller protein
MLKNLNMNKFSLIALALILNVNTIAQKQEFVISAPAGNRYTQINIYGETVIPNGRILTPAGKCFTVAPHPYGLAICKDGNIAITANSGTSPLAFTILRNLNSGNPEIQQVPPGPATDKGVLASVFMGLCISPDNKIVYVAGGPEYKDFIFDIANGRKLGVIDCASKDSDTDYTHGYIGDMVLNRDGSRIYAVDQVGFRMMVIDAVNKTVLYRVPVGRYPLGIALSPDEKTV